PKDPEFMPPLQPCKCKVVNREVETTARITPLMKAKQIFKLIERAKKKKAIAAGYFYNGKTTLSILNTRGFFCSHTFTNAEFSITVSIFGSSGFADASDEDIQKIDANRLFRTALHKAEIGKNPVEIEPGDYPVLLEPIALGSLMWYLNILMDRRTADEGWSFFSRKEGKRIASSNITLFSDPTHAENPALPFDINNEGLPLKKQIWIKNGVLNKLWTTRYWAKKKDVETTGMPSNLIMKGTNTTTEEIIKKVNYGLLVTRLWYIRFVNRKELILTGMTRDGLFLVENGKISKAVKNMRFNDSPFTILSTVKYLGKPERVEGKLLIPSIFAERFHFASTTKF
ncbi:TldD/PmbA family protein, partial [candidate division WOR-3 bacterium]|nr:TldD/PmbA family protein [candidate division WOR-3 bacterium]